MGTLITFVVFMVTIRIVVSILLRNQSKIVPECTRHEWERKNIDDTNPDLGSYLACKLCKRLPGGGFEQS